MGQIITILREGEGENIHSQGFLATRENPVFRKGGARHYRQRVYRREKGGQKEYRGRGPGKRTTNH